MVKWLLKLIVGSRNARVIRGIAPIVVKINEIEKDLQNQPEEVLKDKTAAWKNHLDRYSLRVESYSERILGTRTEEENTALLKTWAERFESLAPEFKRAGTFIASSEVERLGSEAVIGHILEAQRLFHDLKDEFPPARAAYLEQILPEAFAVVKNAARRLCGTEWLVCDHRR
jgi:preprotein translocase subunit SecA